MWCLFCILCIFMCEIIFVGLDVCRVQSWMRSIHVGCNLGPFGRVHLGVHISPSQFFSGALKKWLGVNMEYCKLACKARFAKIIDTDSPAAIYNAVTFAWLFCLIYSFNFLTIKLAGLNFFETCHCAVHCTVHCIVYEFITL